MTERPLPIMIVDDEDAIRMRYQGVLSKNFQNILVARNGQEALDLFQEHPVVPVVITDIDMPIRDGIWLMGQIRSKQPSTQFIVISALTGNSVSIHSAYENTAYLPKPVDQMCLRLVACSAYKAFPVAVFLSKLKQELTLGFDEKKLLAVLRENPWVLENRVVR